MLQSNGNTGGIAPMLRKLRVAYPGAVYQPPTLKLRRDKSSFAETPAAAEALAGEPARQV
jgi:hypothetical protein